MRRRVGADEETACARCRRLAQRLTMPLALGKRQAIKMRAQAALKQGCAVDHQVMRGDRAGNTRRMRANDVGCLRRGDMLDYGLEPGMALEQREEALLHENRLAIENIDCRISSLAMDEQRHADLLHAREHRRKAGDVGDAVLRVGRCTGRIEFGRNPYAFRMSALDPVGGCRVCEITGHERLEIGPGRPRGKNALPISGGCRHGGHRRDEVRHDDAACELRRGERQHRLEHCAVTQMHVPIVGPPYRDGGGRRLGLRVIEQLIDAHAAASLSALRMIATPAAKSSMVMASSGLCEPCSLRTKIMTLGMPSLAKIAASWPAPLGISSSGSPSPRATALSPFTHSGSMTAGADSSLRSSLNSTPRSSPMRRHSERKRS